MKKILILGVASVQSDALEVLNNLGYETHAIAMKKDGPGAEKAQYFNEINILDVDRVIEYIKEKGINVVYSVGSDLAIPIASKVSEVLDLPHFVSYETANICNKKDAMREFLGSDFKGNVSFQILESKFDKLELQFPFIMKPTDSQGQRGVNLIHDEAEFFRLFDSTQSYSRDGLVILEQYISGPEVSVNGYMVDGELTFLEVSDRETWKDYMGLIRKHVVPSKVITDRQRNDLIDIIKQACIKLNIENGPVYVQMKVEDGKPYIIEITPRLDGCHMWKLLKYATNYNLLETTFKHLIENEKPRTNLNTVVSPYELEFACQEPGTLATYEKYREIQNESEEYFYYYNELDEIRPVNGKFEKIGYFINKIED